MAARACAGGVVTRVTIFTHSGAQALVGCLGRLGSPPTPQELRAEQDTADG
jgi:hypothetical protein